MVQFYGKDNDEHYPIWGMNGVSRQNLSAYPDAAAARWEADGVSMVQNTSSELENERREGKTRFLGDGLRLRENEAIASHDRMLLEQELAGAPGSPRRGAQASEFATGWGNLPGGEEADRLGMSYHQLNPRQSAYAYSDDQLVHNSIADIRQGWSTRADELRVPPLPFTGAAGTGDMLGNS